METERRNDDENVATASPPSSSSPLLPYTKCKKTIIRPEHYFLLVRLEVEKSIRELDVALFRNIVFQANTSLFGQSGGGAMNLNLHILRYDAATKTAILRVDKRDFVGCWGALTLFGEYNGTTLRFNVIQVSPFLSSLAAASNSRKFCEDFADDLL
ncbi:Ribonuclease P protein subunit p14 [Balamuthia mandrillaris]